MKVKDNQRTDLCIWSILSFFVIYLKSPILHVVKNLDMISHPSHILSDL